jgi:hypothetical protein
MRCPPAASLCGQSSPDKPRSNHLSRTRILVSCSVDLQLIVFVHVALVLFLLSSRLPRVYCEHVKPLVYFSLLRVTLIHCRIPTPIVHHLAIYPTSELTGPCCTVVTESPELL